MSTQWTAADIPDQSGRVVIVTGANSGLGLVSARELASKGARVVMAVRDEAKGRAAAEAIGASAPGADLEVRRLDLADLDSVRAFADRILADGLDPDVLINNAGVMGPPRTLSAQGHELQFAANHLGHFALTGLLLEALEGGREPRVVTVSSNYHHRGRIHFDDLTGEHGYGPLKYYAQSKFANIVFGLELDRRLRRAESPVRSLMAHPGVASTSLTKSFPLLLKPIAKFVVSTRAQSADLGALPQLHAATAPEARSGEYFGPDGKQEINGYPMLVPTKSEANDPELAARLWSVSEELTGVSYHLPAAA
ncbi:oxidoreductase [Glycomyces xiaoerkulensis]|uniref:oxidoreductase n=1 Tax=Glycomyces xiaoerkulensis TaxID=2038139 RepID=UPI000C25C7A8|nr:oxidoreductase [Glycomyces xiaoerkulensis]